MNSWIGTFESFAIGNEVIRSPRIAFADLFRYTTYTETGSRLPKSVENLPAMLLGVDFLRAHRVLIAPSQGKVYFTYEGGPVFPVNAAKPCSERPALPASGGG